MPSWKAKNIELQPTTTLLDWRVMETERNERHFVGISSQSKHPQVSAVIELYDIQRRVGVTHFGQVYELLGRPRLNLEVDYAWGKWRVAKRISSFADVTRAVVNEPSALRVRGRHCARARRSHHSACFLRS